MAAQLTEGETYLVKATTTNMSTKAGVPVAATLAVNITAVVDSQTILDNSDAYEFAAGQTHTFEFPMAVPVGAGGKAGMVVAEVLDPDGNRLAYGSLDISVAAVGPPSGEILELKWKEYGVADVWHSISESMPRETSIVHRFKVKNTGNVAALFKVGYYHSNYGAGWRYSSSVAVSPGEEAYIEWTLWAGFPGTYTTTWHLFGDETDVDSMTVTTRIV
ncbi:hypothetical protein ES708_02269 [subsurface metagenome]